MAIVELEELFQPNKAKNQPGPNIHDEWLSQDHRKKE